MRSFHAMRSSRRLDARSKIADSDAQSDRIPVARATVDCGVYVDGERLPEKYGHAEAITKVHELERDGQAAFVWVGLHEPNEHQMQAVADEFGLHPLAVEDAVHAHQRPKLERYDETLFLVLKTMNYVPHESVALAREIVETGEIMIFVGKDFVVAVRHGDHSGLAQVRNRLDANPEHMRLGPYAVMHAIADYVVDHYLEVTGLMETDVDSLEEEAFAPGRKTDVEPIYLLKREVVELRRAVEPLSAAFERLHENADLVSEEVRRYMRDVADHQAHAADQISSYDEMLSSLVNAALARVAMQQNVDMRTISAWVAIAVVPTALAGIYGMNFSHMPGLDWKWGYPVTLAVMVGVCVLLYRTFRSNRWL